MGSGSASSATLLVAMLVAACEFIPGTADYVERRARVAAAELLIDPSSALFRNVEAREGVVCGEINGKNRMGAYVGFVRFLVDTSSWAATMESSGEGPYDQGRFFDRTWTARCGPRAAARPHLGYDGSVSQTNALEAVQPEIEAGNDANAVGASVLELDAGESAPSAAPSSDANDAVGEEQLPPTAEPGRRSEGENSIESPRGVTPEWLDRALERRALPPPGD